jgi:predicted AlkP superfamily pyrophosphatase or phosphodiesterase
MYTKQVWAQRISTMLRLLAFAVLFLGAGIKGAWAAERHVVMILIDGLPAYLLDDPQASLPVIRGLAQEGVVAKGGMRVSDPSITWPNQTSLVTGSHADRHGVLFNGGLKRRGPGQLVEYFASMTQEELVRVPLLFDVLKQVAQTSAAINWPCTRGSKSIDDNFPDVPGALAYTTERLRGELTRKGLLQHFEGGNDVVQDEIWTEAACEIIRNRMPRFLALHLNNVDAAHHRYGPRSSPGYAAVALNDANVGRVLRALDVAGVRDKTAVFIVADHGFIATPKSIRPNVVLRREGLLTVENGQIVSAKVFTVSLGGSAMGYLTDPATAREDREAVVRLFQEAEGIAAIVEPKQYARYHLPLPSDNQAMGDFVLAAKDGYVFAQDATGVDLIVANPNPTAGAHGFLSTNPQMNAIFVASGSGIRSGARLTTVENIDVAPTIMRLLGASIPDASGRVIEEIVLDATSSDE